MSFSESVIISRSLPQATCYQCRRLGPDAELDQAFAWHGVSLCRHLEDLIWGLLAERRQAPFLGKLKPEHFMVAFQDLVRWERENWAELLNAV